MVWHFVSPYRLEFKKYYVILSHVVGEYLSADSGKFKSIVAFECRGIEPVEFSPRSGWIVDSEDNGNSFSFQL